MPAIFAGDGGLLLPPVLSLPVSSFGDAVEIEVEEVDRSFEMEELRFCNDDAVVFRARTALEADWID